MSRTPWPASVRTAVGVIAVGLLALGLSACGGYDSGAENGELQQQVDKYAISQIEKDFHESMSRKDIDQMMGLFAENATLTVGKRITSMAR